MAEERNPQVLADWLKKNLKIKGRPTNQTDAKKALNWESDKVTKIKKGNLSTLFAQLSRDIQGSNFGFK